MSSEDLGALLAQLHERLRSARSLDPESRKLLATVARDIEQALASDGASAVAAEPVEALAVRFEADHPSLAGRLAPNNGHAGQSRNLGRAPRARLFYPFCQNTVEPRDARADTSAVPKANPSRGGDAKLPV